jgi:hypothetical protein
MSDQPCEKCGIDARTPDNCGEPTPDCPRFGVGDLLARLPRLGIPPGVYGVTRYPECAQCQRVIGGGFVCTEACGREFK